MKPYDVLTAVINRCIAEGAPVYVNQPLFREHHPLCGFLRRGLAQTPCNCAQLVSQAEPEVQQ